MTDILNETAPRVERKTINSIQFLRGAAALLVLVEHLRIESGLYPYGAVGVDLFFVISGFIIFFVTESDQRNFFLKRIIRIVPLYWLVTFAIAAITIAKPSLFNSASFGVAHFFWSLFFIPHYTEAQGLRPLLALGWTLNYEMMFYLLFAAGMAISHKWRFEITSLLLLGLFLIANALPIGPTHGFSFYGDAIILEFIFGMARAKHLHRQPVTSRVAMLSLVTVTLALFLIVTIWRPTGVGRQTAPATCTVADSPEPAPPPGLQAARVSRAMARSGARCMGVRPCRRAPGRSRRRLPALTGAAVDGKRGYSPRAAFWAAWRGLNFGAGARRMTSA